MHYLELTHLCMDDGIYDLFVLYFLNCYQFIIEAYAYLIGRKGFNRHGMKGLAFASPCSVLPIFLCVASLGRITRSGSDLYVVAPLLVGPP